MTTKIKKITLEDACRIISNNDEGHLKLAGQLMLARYRVMHYYGEQVLASQADIDEFCLEGMECCEGCERDRLVNLYTANSEHSRFHIFDCAFDEIDDYRDLDLPIITMEQFYDFDLHIERLRSLRSA